ncbi:hypothetical protein WM00_07800 [Burkholderia cepacia]|nr:hypothetical protein WM00_07800 [Burkholderia cepacia]
MQYAECRLVPCRKKDTALKRGIASHVSKWANRSATEVRCRDRLIVVVTRLEEHGIDSIKSLVRIVLRPQCRIGAYPGNQRVVKYDIAFGAVEQKCMEHAVS